ncbi:hypothetical protein BDY21DRAFT_158965 [Lineolata rhizophorae]|uniref:Uncharacterized protein n=1 Tax=Lineolata rhizophorae TaxID=578093 RepID=A0A6A6NLG2_9PEZI|nr:hypothetical protein BDY21DRAFT_158965 [Lineolata rhizophorae]
MPLEGWDPEMSRAEAADLIYDIFDIKDYGRRRFREIIRAMSGKRYRGLFDQMCDGERALFDAEAMEYRRQISTGKQSKARKREKTDEVENDIKETPEKRAQSSLIETEKQRTVSSTTKDEAISPPRRNKARSKIQQSGDSPIVSAAHVSTADETRRATLGAKKELSRPVVKQEHTSTSANKQAHPEPTPIKRKRGRPKKDHSVAPKTPVRPIATGTQTELDEFNEISQKLRDKVQDISKNLVGDSSDSWSLLFSEQAVDKATCIVRKRKAEANISTLWEEYGASSGMGKEEFSAMVEHAPLEELDTLLNPQKNDGIGQSSERPRKRVRIVSESPQKSTSGSTPTLLNRMGTAHTSADRQDLANDDAQPSAISDSTSNSSSDSTSDSASNSTSASTSKKEAETTVSSSSTTNTTNSTSAMSGVLHNFNRVSSASTSKESEDVSDQESDSSASGDDEGESKSSSLVYNESTEADDVPKLFLGATASDPALDSVKNYRQTHPFFMHASLEDTPDELAGYLADVAQYAQDIGVDKAGVQKCVEEARAAHETIQEWLLYQSGPLPVRDGFSSSPDPDMTLEDLVTAPREASPRVETPKCSTPVSSSRHSDLPNRTPEPSEQTRVIPESPQPMIPEEKENEVREGLWVMNDIETRDSPDDGQELLPEEDPEGSQFTPMEVVEDSADEGAVVDDEESMSTDESHSQLGQAVGEEFPTEQEVPAASDITTAEGVLQVQPSGENVGMESPEIGSKELLEQEIGALENEADDQHEEERPDEDGSVDTTSNQESGTPSRESEISARKQDEQPEDIAIDEAVSASATPKTRSIADTQSETSETAPVRPWFSSKDFGETGDTIISGNWAYPESSAEKAVDSTMQEGFRNPMIRQASPAMRMGISPKILMEGNSPSRNLLQRTAMLASSLIYVLPRP